MKQCEAIIKVCPKIYGQQPKKTGKNVPCLEKTKKDFLLNSGDSVAFQKGQISVVA